MCKKEKQNKEIKPHQSQVKKKRGRPEGVPPTRVYQVDMLRVESCVSSSKMHKIELETREKISTSLSPYDELQEKEKEKHFQKLRKKLCVLAEQSKLTKSQKECFRLICIKQMEMAEAAKAMQINRKTFSEMFQLMQRKLKRTLEYRERVQHKALELINKKRIFLTPFERELITMRFEEWMSTKEIAEHFSKNERTIRRKLKKMGLFHPYFNYFK